MAGYIRRPNYSTGRARQLRITNNDFIVSSSYTYIFNSKSQFFERDFSQFRIKVEAAGGLLNTLASTYN
ncbi:MAG: hypothetical protein ACFNUH_06110, partial [Bacteroidota bacterium]